MSLKQIVKIPTEEEIKSAYPVPADVAAKKAERDVEIAKVFTGESDKLLLIIGPCSADSEDAVCEYVSRLAAAQEKVSDKIIMIPRIYTNKPRTTGEGYKGILYQPDPTKAPDMREGLISLRKMHLRAMRESGLAAADEMLYPENYPYLDDVLAYVAVGARSVENQQHRLVASGVDVPVGMKNPTSGDLGVMLNSIYAAQHSHTISYGGWQVETEGNPLAHAILRGAVSRHGNVHPNYHYEDLLNLCKMYRERGLKNPAVIIDTNHANSGKNYLEQPRIAKEVLHSCRHNADIKGIVKGLMIESYLCEGSQSVGPDQVYGKSITDACIGWEDTYRLIMDIAEELS